jgi:hypothetical protein
MTEKLSYIEKMEYLHVLNETKQLLNDKLQGASDPQQRNSMEDDLQKIEQELGGILAQNPELENYDTLNFVFPYFSADND